jgi:hypothetical protein
MARPAPDRNGGRSELLEQPVRITELGDGTFRFYAPDGPLMPSTPKVVEGKQCRGGPAERCHCSRPFGGTEWAKGADRLSESGFRNESRFRRGR